MSVCVSALSLSLFHTTRFKLNSLASPASVRVCVCVSLGVLFVIYATNESAYRSAAVAATIFVIEMHLSS